METGTIYMVGCCDDLELLIVDLDDDYFEHVKVAGEIVSDVPQEMQEHYRLCLHHRTRVSKEFAREWLNQ